MKICNVCHTKKGLDSFNKDSRSGLYRNYCKLCGTAASSKRSKTVEGVISRMYSSQKTCSVRRGHEKPCYTKDELSAWVESQGNFKGIYNRWVFSGYKKDLSVSCDRIDDYKPYSLCNIQLTTWKENNDRGNRDIRNGINNKQAKSVVQLSKDGEVIREFYSAHQASRVTGLNRGHISSCCRGNTNLKTHGGFKWEFSAF